MPFINRDENGREKGYDGFGTPFDSDLGKNDTSKPTRINKIRDAGIAFEKWKLQTKNK